jgi:hypothetical protein
MAKPKVKKKAFPMGYKSPKVRSMASTGSGQRQTVASNERRMKSALKAGMRSQYKPSGEADAHTIEGRKGYKRK